jgi:hypothetical protein
MSETQTRKYVLEALLDGLNKGFPFVILGLKDEEIPIKATAQTFGKYWSSVDLVGYGVFQGETEHGRFSFCGGSALTKPVLPDGDYLAYSPITFENEAVLADLEYPFEQVIRAIECEIAELIECELVTS